MDDVETSHVLFTMNNDTSTTHVTTTSDHDDVASIERNKVGDFALLKVKLHSVVDLDGWIRVSDGATVVRDDVRDTLGTDGHFADLEQFVASLLGSDAVNSETTLHVIQQTEMFARLFDRDSVCLYMNVLFE